MNAPRIVVALAAGLAAGALVPSLRGADHGDSPQVRIDTRADINDVYLFASPQTPGNTVMIMTVCPLAGVTAPKLFATGVAYEFAVDTDGDAKENQLYRVTFGRPDEEGHQKFTLTGPNKTKAKGTTQTTATVGVGGKIVCGIFDDPFFFDLIGFKRGLQFSPTAGRNFFNGLNTLAIVLEVPTASFGTLSQGKMGIWARTKRGRFQIDRMGRPAINTVLISGTAAGGGKDLFNQTTPKDDQSKWRVEVVKNLKAAPLSRSDVDANGLADVLLPDILTYDTTNAGGFLNGRKLDDDVIDAELNLLSAGAVTTDFIGNDSTFQTVFPYLGAANP